METEDKVLLLFISPFLLMSIFDYWIPVFFDLTVRTSVLFFILGAIYQLIAIVMVGFVFLLKKKKRYL